MITRKAIYNEADDRLIISSTQDVEDIMNHNQYLRNLGRDANRSKDKTFYHVAEIPLIVVEQWMKEGINVFKKEDWPRVKKKLNDYDNYKLRIWDGKL